MELALYRVYKNGTRKFIFSEESGNVDTFTMGFDNERDMLNYFSDMSKVYNPDGSIDIGNFMVAERRLENGSIVIERHPVYYGNDFNTFVIELGSRLRNDKELLSHLLKSYPDIFDSKLREKFESSIDIEIPFPVYKLNVDSFSNSLFSSAEFKKEFRFVVENIGEYYMNREAISSDGKGAKILKFTNGNK